jgi:hypothetical protein
VDALLAAASCGLFSTLSDRALSVEVIPLPGDPDIAKVKSWMVLVFGFFIAACTDKKEREVVAQSI